VRLISVPHFLNDFNGPEGVHNSRFLPKKRINDFRPTIGPLRPLTGEHLSPPGAWLGNSF
jgi:hypothetical protein